ncbi:response regulator transcription factor [Proteiniphilum sp.]|uniref:response regulator transcription factor n=1 Tax=Proteiniphilum sp. TaxID=1926877 RepID=UPI002B1FE531|nr:response regulator transcription factor [Proteiniphilum sp.]MEA4918953.1 response regulator transcription factor [Proteiniphilum sp.]
MDLLRVILVDDDLEFGNIICTGLTILGYKVHFQTSLAGIEEVIKQFSPSIIVLDVEIGEENSIKKAKELISLFPSIPILFVSSHKDISYITEGIEAGAVNYLEKPFELIVLSTYIKRFASKDLVSKKISIGNYSLNTDTNQLFYNDLLFEKITPLERNALVLFWKNKNKPVTIELLSRDLWGREYSSELDPKIHNLISRLRKLLKRDEHVVRIITVKNEGYQLSIL